jgi:hypothetical protein
MIFSTFPINLLDLDLDLDLYLITKLFTITLYIIQNIQQNIFVFLIILIILILIYYLDKESVATIFKYVTNFIGSILMPLILLKIPRCGPPIEKGWDGKKNIAISTNPFPSSYKHKNKGYNPPKKYKSPKTVKISGSNG